MYDWVRRKEGAEQQGAEKCSQYNSGLRLKLSAAATRSGYLGTGIREGSFEKSKFFNEDQVYQHSI
jgi:hypothetical protein